MKLPICKLEFDLARVREAEPVVDLSTGAVGLRLTFDDTTQIDIHHELDVAMLAAGFCACLRAVRGVVGGEGRGA